MKLDLKVLSGSRTGEREHFEKSVVTFGRHPLCDFRFDAEKDLDVSARHAEIRVAEGRYVLRDLTSTNGTFVNGVRLQGEVRLSPGDILGFGEFGPKLEVRFERRSEDDIPDVPRASRAARPPTSAISRPPGYTAERIAEAVEEHTARLQRMLLAIGLLLVLAVAGGFLLLRNDRRARDREIAILLARADSLGAVNERATAGLSSRVHGMDSALAAARGESDRLRSEVLRARRGGADVQQLAMRLDQTAARQSALFSAAQLDYSRISELDDAATAIVAVRWSDGRSQAGTGFGITRDGLLVTSRHLVAQSGDQPERVLVIFSNTRTWLPAHVVRSADSASGDFAFLQLDDRGTHPVVAGIARSSSTKVGSPVALIGYPLALDLPMTGSGTRITARSTIGAGTVSKMLDTLLQVDAYAAEGSSGTPIFNTAGYVIGIVWGGARESAGRIVYAVPSDLLISALPEEAKGLVH
ncbi:MAG: trypsin-like peptidase domain-containing protein [Gemmatimonadota bacterium]|nr:trypsin-like peptidase domain-containing protein [Gemmatimonadota bacterium]